VQIAAGAATATTDADGKFLLRNLPAGDLKVTVTPVKPVPAGMNIPSGVVKLPAEPVQVQGATIVITNSDLLPYLSREFDKTPATATRDSSTATATTPTEMKPVAPAMTRTKPALSVTAESPVSSTSPGESATRPTAVDNVAPVPPIPPVLPRTDVSGAAPTAPPDAVLTREICNQLPSLGEIAQCLRQLKLNSSTNPK
ncbi:MAG TPA: hypothetical protein VJT08_15600, partial [Terriglobales bacterium]|nr:hypothetical protein [Terriglobales bacterium]